MTCALSDPCGCTQPRTFPDADELRENQLASPSMGSWVTYGLGTENNNLPGFVVLCPNGYPVTETQTGAPFSARNLSGDYVNPARKAEGNYPQPQPRPFG